MHFFSTNSLLFDATCGNWVVTLENDSTIVNDLTRNPLPSFYSSSAPLPFLSPSQSSKKFGAKIAHFSLPLQLEKENTGRGLQGMQFMSVN